jgi:imidazolonepropionase-like amidohydrolase
MLREAGFTPEQTVQIMSLNGARILGVDTDLGTVQAGTVADLVVIRGDLTGDASAIRYVVTVFEDGIGYDSAKLLESVRGRVGIQ